MKEIGKRLPLIASQHANPNRKVDMVICREARPSHTVREIGQCLNDRISDTHEEANYGAVLERHGFCNVAVMLQDLQGSESQGWFGTALVVPSRRPLGLKDLMSGGLAITAFSRRDEMFVVSLAARSAQPCVPLHDREQKILESLLSGRSQKQIGYDFELSPATISGAIRRILRKLGAGCWEQLIAAACALRAAAQPRTVASSDVAALVLEISTTLRPGVLSLITPAEREVALHVICGCSNAEIGKLRRTSARTVANQISGLFRKLEVRGRLELILRLLVAEPGQA